MGVEADRLRRVTGVRNAGPELIFSQELLVFLGKRRVQFQHRPGPMPGSIWVLIPECAVAFIGDAVAVSEPPYLGEADIQAWLSLLDELRSPAYRDVRLVSSRDGLVGRAEINAMGRFLRRVAHRLEKWGQKRRPAGAIAASARGLAKGFKLSGERKEQALLRLEVGLTRLYTRLYPDED
jgi:glyoxylase-like metal-dependent hydrolase (beta-lactamase superfamily II)